MMDSLDKNGYIMSEYTSSNITLYKITQKGIQAYQKWIKDFLDFARSTNITTALNDEPLKKSSDNDTNDG